MLYRRFGKTNLQMPVFSCGGMRYQFKWEDKPLAEIPPDNQANLEATIRKAVEVGINHIETARGYGSSERQLGLVLPTFPREKLIVQTKIGPSDNADDFTRNFEDSLARLQLQHVELLSIHGINNDHGAEQSLKPGGCLAAARKIQQRGLARHIGFSTHGPLDVILKAIKHEADGGFDYVNLHWYYIWQHNWPAVLEATRRDMGVFIISPTDKGGKLYDPPAKLVELCQPVHPITFNDVFCLSKPQVHTLSVGAARPSDFDLHLEALPHLASPEKTRELLAPILERLQQAYDAAVPAERRNPWALNLPRWEDSPGKINVQIALWLYNLAQAFDMTGFGQMRYNLLSNGGHWFPGESAEKAGEFDWEELGRRSGLGGQLKHLLLEAHELLAKEKVKRLSQS